ncbi:Uncharacterized protein PBTT_00182 [Plasmodiophora brassicae]|uniref:Uncharacterized protein n=1 Tax=Plasmodiophora brassicae TaxID=37360 RepID=A0A0G4J3Z2_PLABS|nr:hypothetical protein PBRA_002477 [Plasmodiophora brassicae]SPQ93602.1 unnamed protein product [Plasmodiophora brassicae]
MVNATPDVREAGIMEPTDLDPVNDPALYPVSIAPRHRDAQTEEEIEGLGSGHNKPLRTGETRCDKSRPHPMHKSNHDRNVERKTKKLVSQLTETQPEDVPKAF